MTSMTSMTSMTGGYTLRKSPTVDNQYILDSLLSAYDILLNVNSEVQSVAIMVKGKGDGVINPTDIFRFEDFQDEAYMPQRLRKFSGGVLGRSGLCIQYALIGLLWTGEFKEIQGEAPERPEWQEIEQ